MSSSCNFDNINVVFCDSLEALEKAYKDGLSRTALVKTISPNLILSTASNIESLEDRMGEETYSKLFYSRADFAELLYRELLEVPSLKRCAVLLTRVAVSNEKRLIKAGLLSADDFVEPRAVIEFDTGDGPTNRRMQSIWSELLQGNRHLKCVCYSVESAKERDAVGGEVVDLAERLRFTSAPSLRYRILESLGRKLPGILFKSRIVILSEGEVVKEAGSYLGLRGYKLNKVKVVPVATNDLQISEEQETALQNVVGNLLKNRAISVAQTPAVTGLVEGCLGSMRDAILRFDKAVKSWTRNFEADPPAAVLTGYPDGPEVLAMARVAREHGVPFFAFQHGLDREITLMHDKNHIHFENSVADHFVTYTNLSKQLSAENIFDGRLEEKPCKIFAAGLSKEHHSVAKPSNRIDAEHPILFVSTALYRGYFALRTDAGTDISTAKEELRLINQVLDKLPHKVAFKPYPAMRYPDPDVVMDAVRRSMNIDLVGEFIDLRYIISNYRVLIVSRATSTVGWCLMSQRPLVYIDIPHWFSLRPSAREIFEKAVFFFDSRADGWVDALQTFLSKPIEDIEREWAARQKYRAELMGKFVHDQSRGAGKRAAKYILNVMREEN